MNSDTESCIFHYWGKADPSYPHEQKWHPLAYHSLDVTAVAAVWWDSSQSLRANLLAAFADEKTEASLRAWVLFFVALHDLGKFDLRFQLKAPEALALAWRSLQMQDHALPPKEIKEFDHGHAGLAWANKEFAHWLGADDTDRVLWDSWRPWLTAVTGHHGDYSPPLMAGLQLDTDEALIEHDRQARHAYVAALERLFLRPCGMDLNMPPPACHASAQALLAGFCSVCDWIGSNTEAFAYQNFGLALPAYFYDRLQHTQQHNVLQRFGLIANVKPYAGLRALLSAGESPRGVQVEIDALPATSGLTLIEAPTGSGKTEAALAYAWRLLDAGVADSIVFALPTQATANAMLKRAEAFANQAFGEANVVLAHGKRQFNEAFQKLAEGGRRVTAQGKIEAGVQCAQWLASSRKRVFLGQIGVCTVDQVLLSVLPVRHKFVRGFGVNKSVLIVDEVHAYDAYMNGLLGEVLRRQQVVGGSVILLSATLHASARGKLLEAWQCNGQGDAPYPAVWHAVHGRATCVTVPPDQRPVPREVTTECFKLPGAFPDDALIERIVNAAQFGARVAVVMNLVDDAQRLARLLLTRTEIDVDVFHARYRFIDRQAKEKATLNHYGRETVRDRGRILVATQVVEQSLDLDFDWMVTQICPVDLLFQRLGRLHRHKRDQRPPGFEAPRCTVLSVDGDGYGLHKLIYGNTRVLWRTEQLLVANERIVFPEAYRDWIEQVYQRDDWPDEPETIALEFDQYCIMQRTREKDAQQLTTMTVRAFRDDDARVTGLTRDGEMSLTVLPLQSDGRLLDGQALSELTAQDVAETINLNTAPVPASWKNHLRGYRQDVEGPLAGCWQLEMRADDAGGWQSVDGKFRYSKEFGLEKIKNESA